MDTHTWIQTKMKTYIYRYVRIYNQNVSTVNRSCALVSTSRIIQIQLHKNTCVYIHVCICINGY